MLKLSVSSKLSRAFSYRRSNSYGSKKIFASAQEALKDVKNGSKLLVGGFGLCGIPENSIRTLLSMGVKDLTCVSNDAGIETWGLGLLLREGRIKRIVGSYMGENPMVERMYHSGELELEILPQGTFAQKIAAGAAGIPAFYNPTGLGTFIEEGGFPIKYSKVGRIPEITSEPRQKVLVHNKEYLVEHAIRGNFALIKAQKADTYGNLIFHKTARNFNEDMAGAADVTIAEVEEIVEPGQIKPEEVHLPGVYVHRIFKGEKFEKPFSHLVYDHEDDVNKMGKTKLRIAKRAQQELKEGVRVNLGIGIPTMVAALVGHNFKCVFHGENGILGMGRYPKKGEEDPDLINPGKETITALPGSSYFSSAKSFSIIRGRHLDMTMLGGMQVSSQGDLASWYSGKNFKGVGGAMDLVYSGIRVIILMQHATRDGELKILNKCKFPLTGRRVVDTLITEMGVFKFVNGEIVLQEIAKEYSVEDVEKKTECKFKVADNLRPF